MRLDQGVGRPRKGSGLLAQPVLAWPRTRRPYPTLYNCTSPLTTRSNERTFASGVPPQRGGLGACQIDTVSSRRGRGHDLFHAHSVRPLQRLHPGTWPFFFFFSFGLWLPRTRFYLFSFFHRLILPPPNCAFLWARLGPHSASKARPGKGAASGCRGDGSQSARSARRNSAICSARWPRGLRPYMFSPRAPLPRISAALRHPEESGQRMTGVNTRVKTQVLAQLRAGVGEPRRSLPARSK